MFRYFSFNLHPFFKKLKAEQQPSKSKEMRQLLSRVQGAPNVHGTQQADKGVIMAGRLQDRVWDDERFGVFTKTYITVLTMLKK